MFPNVNYSIRIDEVDASNEYIGKASYPGAVETDAVWNIRKIVVTGTVTKILHASGHGNFDTAWDLKQLKMSLYKYVYNPITDEFDLVNTPGITQTEFEFIAPGNTGKNQTGNWKFLIDSSFNFCKYKCIATHTWELVEINAFFEYPY